MTITKCQSHVSDSGIRKILQDQALNQLYYPNKSAQKIDPTDVEIFRNYVLDTIGNSQITYLEFGVANGYSMYSMMNRFTHPDSKFFGFDSFEGLPESWDPLPSVNLEQGSFSTRGGVPPSNDLRVEFIKGWIQNTLPPFVSRGAVGGPWPHLIHYDVDLYSATLFILSTLWHYLPEYYFIMDEYLYDEIVALRDFACAFPVSINFIAETGDKMFGSMRRVPFSI